MDPWLCETNVALLAMSADSEQSVPDREQNPDQQDLLKHLLDVEQLLGLWGGGPFASSELIGSHFPRYPARSTLGRFWGTP